MWAGAETLLHDQASLVEGAARSGEIVARGVNIFAPLDARGGEVDAGGGELKSIPRFFSE